MPENQATDRSIFSAEAASSAVLRAPSADAAATENTLQPELLQTDDVKKIIETLLFITDRPVKASRLAEVVETVNAKQVADLVAELREEYAQSGRAIQIVEVGGGYQMSTKSEYGRWIRKLYNEKMTTKLSNAALETLAIVAYKQPLTRAEMEAIRGVDVAAPLERLLERGLVRVVGKKDTIGRPMVYGTTDEFLRMFGLNKVAELPDLQIFAAKTLRDQQADLPFGDPLPPVAEPGIIALEDLDGVEKLDALGNSVDSFFTRTTYNRGDLFVKELASAARQVNPPLAEDDLNSLNNGVESEEGVLKTEQEARVFAAQAQALETAEETVDPMMAQEVQEHFENRAAALQVKLETKADEVAFSSSEKIEVTAEKQKSTEEK